MKMSKNILFCLNNRTWFISRISKIGLLSPASHVHVHVGRHFWHDSLKYFRYLLIKKKVWIDQQSLLLVVSYYSQNAARRCILIYAVNFKLLLISACTYLAMARAVKFNQSYHDHSFELMSSLVFARKAFGSVETRNFVSKNIARSDNFTSWHGRMKN